MGFAVVADELRNLAQCSAQAARETAALIDDSIAEESASAAEELSANAAQMLSIVDRLTALVDGRQAATPRR